MTENRSTPRKRRALVEMTVVKVSPYLRAEKPLMWLSEKDATEPRLLPIAVGEFEAAAIQMQLSGERPLRPISYDLFASFLDELSVPVRRVVIHSVEGQVFHAVAVVERESRLREIDCRPSDGVALALRTDAPIFISGELLDAAGLSSVPEYADLERTISRFYELEPQILGDSEVGETSLEALLEDVGAEPAVPADKARNPLQELEHRLEQAVLCEEYEEAAMLRDEIERLKSTQT
jgi:bifunctional DNase/RNase